MTRPRFLRLLLLALPALGLASALAGCEREDNQPDSASWRNVSVDLPDGWYVLEQEDTRFSIASHDLTAVDDDGTPVIPDGDVLAMYFTYEPGTIPDDWRSFVRSREGTIESDQQLVLGQETPATRLIFSFVSNEVPTREMVVVIPSRHIVVLAQPVPRPGETDAQETFLRHLDVFLEVLESAEFGAPVLD